MSATVWAGPSSQIDDAMNTVAKDRPDILIVLGGDGTIRTAAQYCTKNGPILLPLPGGTMNVLPKALYGARSWRQALRDTLKASAVQAVHGAQVAGHRFYVAGVFGSAALLAQARESVRHGKIISAFGQGAAAVKEALGHEIRYAFDDHASKAEAVVVLCPLPPPASGAEILLDAAAIDIEGAGDALRLAILSAFRDWRTDPTVTHARLTRVEINCDDAIPAILDGERFDLSPAERIEILPEAFYALRPA